MLNTSKTETRRDGKISRVGNTWDLFRVKGDYIIQIQCYVQKQEKDVELNSDVELEDLLSMFTTYDSHFNPDSESNNDSSNEGGNSTSDNSSGYNIGDNNSSGNNPDDNSSSGSNIGGENNNYETNSSGGNNAGDNNSSGNSSGDNSTGGSNINSSSGNNVGDINSNGNNTGGNNANSNISAAHTHNYANATCTEPKTCTVCGATVGSATGHTWEAVHSTVHHDQEGHYEWIKVKDGVEWYHCPKCGDEFTSLDGYYLHFDSSHSDVWFLREDYTHGTMVEDEYEEVWVVDREAYDEAVIVGYECSKCGATKQ